MFKKFFLLFFTFSFFHVLFAQTPSVRMGVLKGISCVPCAYLIENRAKLSVQNRSFKIYDSVQGELPALLKDELDVGFLPVKDAVKVFNKGYGAVVALGVVQNDNLWLLKSGETYESIEELKGKTVACAENDSSNSELLRYLLPKKGLSLGGDENSVKLDFSVPVANIPNSLILGNIQYAFVEEPFATVAQIHSSKIIRAASVSKIYYETESGNSLPAMLLVADSEFAKQNIDLIGRLCELYKNVVSWTMKNPSKAALLAEKHSLGLSSEIVRAAIPNANFVWRDIENAKPDVEKHLVILQQEFPSGDFYIRH